MNEVKEFVLEYGWLETAIAVLLLLVSGLLACWSWVAPGLTPARFEASK